MSLLADVMKTILNEQGNDWPGATKDDADNENMDFKEQKEYNVAKNTTSQIIAISNKNSVEKSKYGEKYKQNLDPRDQMLTHIFQFILEIPYETAKAKTSFMKSQAYQTLC